MAYARLKYNSAESGTTGTTVTIANSAGSGIDAFPTVTIGTGATLTYDTAHLDAGSLAFKLTQTSTGQSILRWTLASATADLAFGAYLYYSATPLVQDTLCRFFSDAGYLTAAVSVNLTTANKLNIIDNVAGTQTTSSGALTPGSEYIIRFRYASGTLTAAAYPKGSGTATATATIGVSAYTLQSTWFGIGATTNSGLTMWLDNVEVGTGGDVPRTDIAAAPTAVITGVSTSSTAVQFSGTSSTAVSPATISSYAWNFGDAGTSTSSAPSHTYATTGPFTVTLTVTDSNSATNQATYPIVISTAAATQGTAVVLPASGVTIDPSLASTTPQAILTTADGSGWLAIPSGTSQTIPMPPIIYTAGQPLTFTLLLDRFGLPTTGTVQVEMMEGATSRSSQTALPVALSTNGTTVTATVTAQFPATDCATMTQFLFWALRVTPTGT